MPLKRVVKLRTELSENDTTSHPKLFKIGPNRENQLKIFNIHVLEVSTLYGKGQGIKADELLENFQKEWEGGIFNPKAYDADADFGTFNRAF